MSWRFGETVECLARNEVQGDLSFELDAMGAVLGHGFHPLKARQRRSIPNLQAVHRQGRIPSRDIVQSKLCRSNVTPRGDHGRIHPQNRVF